MYRFFLKYLIFFILFSGFASYAKNSELKNEINNTIISHLSKGDAFIYSPSLEEIKIYVDLSKIRDDYEEKPNISLELRNIDKKNNRFSAIVTLDHPNLLEERLEIRGKFFEYTSVPALNKRIKKNSIIKKDDIEWIKINVNKIANDFITDEIDIIGKEAKHSLHPHRAVFNKDIQEPILVSKKKLVNIVYEKKSIYLQLDGIALEDGAKGEIIKVKNSKTDRVINAKVIDKNKVQVQQIEG